LSEYFSSMLLSLQQRASQNRLLALSLMVWALLGASLFASTPEPVHRTILEQLNHEDYAIRQRASSALLTDQKITSETIRQLYERATTFEQHHRLMAAARHHLLRQIHEQVLGQLQQDSETAVTTAAIGLIPTAVSAEELPQLGSSAIRVERTFAGFPGYAYLQPGDLIIAADGRSFPIGVSKTQMKNHFVNVQIKKHQVGDVIRLAIVRNSRRMETGFRLASLKVLEQMYDPKDEDPKEPYRSQWIDFQLRLRALEPRTPALRVPPLKSDDTQP